MAEHLIFRVRVRHNVVCRLDSIAKDDNTRIPELEVSTQLARNHQQQGSIDGDYLFDEVDTAKYFAILSQEFVKKLVDKTIVDLERIRSSPEQTWRNPYGSVTADAGDR